MNDQYQNDQFRSDTLIYASIYKMTEQDLDN